MDSCSDRGMSDMNKLEIDRMAVAVRVLCIGLFAEPRRILVDPLQGLSLSFFLEYFYDGSSGDAL